MVNHDCKQHIRGTAMGILVGIVAVVAAAAGAAYFLYCPCGPLPGGYLLGDEITQAVDDWSMANDVGLCQLQVAAAALPHSINLNCMSTQGRLYLSCSSCAGKRWSQAALADPNARIRIDDRVFPVRVTRVSDPAILDAAWLARASKLGLPLETPRAEGWWSFQVESR